MLELIIIALLLVITQIALYEHRINASATREIVKALKLTDMVLSTDARYTRHPSQADLFSAFQDSPGALEHFPSGSVIFPPELSLSGMAIEIKKQ